MNKLLDTLNPVTTLAGRILIAAIFVTAGWSKIGGYAGTQAYMESAGVPGALLPLVILVELGGGLAIVAGLLTRYVAIALAGFSIVSAALFHAGSDPMQQILFMKNLAMAGGFLFLVANGAGSISLDAWLASRRHTPTAALAA
ncbi:DoxX family protein [Sinimarinibacterium sp. CAU 1509]|uniref:DoxX family protein n=1 Tax=Sinimarinibacterium sp. CAU 1509 TaxID=2562283 RepID=UPI0010AC908B|nr:DoxX family protein [Sinimarinibacterium sp. CAU 1509]TJY59306.1 DoxX family protein [Sinimarinibacterium sp. CAU 1509]